MGNETFIRVADFVQIILGLPFPFSLIGTLIIAFAIFHGLKAFFLLFSGLHWLRTWYLRLFWGADKTARTANFVLCLGCAFFCYFYRADLSDYIQSFETPVYDGQYAYMGDTATCKVFEGYIRRQIAPDKAQTVIRYTHRLCDSLNFPPNWMYQVANVECGLNPFTIRKDRVAAGWIQFTRKGLSGIAPAKTLGEMIAACEAKDAEMIMRQTDAYMLHHCAGKKITRPVDVYLAVFAPAKMGAPESDILYQGWESSAYYLNKGLDGWQKDGDGRIMRREKWCDGIITVKELGLCMEAKKNQFLLEN